MIYKRVLTEMAFGQEARGSELFKRNSIPGRGNRLCNGPEAGRGKGGGAERGAGGANTGTGTVVIRPLSTLSPKLPFRTRARPSRYCGQPPNGEAFKLQ